ncbi:MAG: hypothetical protein IT168_07095 [Bryobacterales bacterium]|nr:hypothetical protein [Bryobacterales bacterium]
MVDCPVCRHPHKATIEGLLESGCSTWEAAPICELMPGELQRHLDHVERSRRRAAEADVQFGADASAQLSLGSNRLFFTIRGHASHNLDQAKKSGDARTVQSSIRQLESLISLAAKLDTQVDAEADAEQQFLQNPKWTEFKMRLLRSLEMYPEAYRAVLESLDV